MAANLRGIAAAWRNLSPASRWRVVLAAIAAGFLVWILVAEKPWNIALDPKPKVRQVVPHCTWYGAAFGFLVTSLLAALASWWTASPRPPIENRKSPIDVAALHPGGAAWRQSVSLRSAENPRWFWPLVVCAMALTAVFAYPRLGFGFWDDEELCARDSLVGRFRLDEKTDAVRFQPLKWQIPFSDTERRTITFFTALSPGFRAIRLASWPRLATCLFPKKRCACRPMCSAFSAWPRSPGF